MNQTKSIAPTLLLDPADLRLEIQLLEQRRDDLRLQVDELEQSTQAHPAGENIYVFDDQDEKAEAFDEFFSHTDAEVRKIRDDLLKESASKRRFGRLSARLGR